MRIEQLDEPELDRSEGRQIVRVDEAKRALVGAGARILFYPTLLYNVLRNKMEAEFRWWDEVDQVFDPLTFLYPVFHVMCVVGIFLIFVLNQYLLYEFD